MQQTSTVKVAAIFLVLKKESAEEGLIKLNLILNIHLIEII